MTSFVPNKSGIVRRRSEGLKFALRPPTTGLAVDSSKARARLDWRPRLSLEAAVDWTARWYREAWMDSSRDPAELIGEQTSAYEALARP